MDDFFQRLDQASQEAKSPQTRRQTKPRVMGEPSSRPRPALLGFCDGLINVLLYYISRQLFLQLTQLKESTGRQPKRFMVLNQSSSMDTFLIIIM